MVILYVIHDHHAIHGLVAKFKNLVFFGLFYLYFCCCSLAALLERIVCMHCVELFRVPPPAEFGH